MPDLYRPINTNQYIKSLLLSKYFFKFLLLIKIFSLFLPEVKQLFSKCSFFIILGLEVKKGELSLTLYELELKLDEFKLERFFFLCFFLFKSLIF